jgi:catechol 2,3-dioxygenase-like lactoylglutathione lyase family enzyme
MLGDATLLTNLNATDFDASIEFYGRKLGLELVWDGELLPGSREVLFQAGAGIVCLDQGHAASGEHSPLSFVVDDVDETVTSLREHGVVFEDYDLPSLKTQNGIATIGTVKAAWFKDPAGNLLAVTSNIESLKALVAPSRQAS